VPVMVEAPAARLFERLGSTLEKPDFAGMTTYERLYVAGLMPEWDAAAVSRDRKKMVEILCKVMADVVWGHPSGKVEATFPENRHSINEWPEATPELVEELHKRKHWRCGPLMLRMVAASSRCVGRSVR
jgi:hypothetical protein